MRRNYSLVKFDSISDICKDTGQVFFASMLIDPVLKQSFNAPIILIGLAATLAAWSAGLALSTK